MSQFGPGERVEEALAEEGLPTPDVVIEPDADRLARAVSSALVARLAAAQAVHGTASVVLTGGGIGTAVLRRVADLAAEPEHAVVDWQQVDVWWGDERFVAADSSDRNELGAREAFLGRVGLDPERIHPMPPPTPASTSRKRRRTGTPSSWPPRRRTAGPFPASTC